MDGWMAVYVCLWVNRETCSFVVWWRKGTSRKCHENEEEELCCLLLMGKIAFLLSLRHIVKSSSSCLFTYLARYFDILIVMLLNVKGRFLHFR